MAEAKVKKYEASKETCREAIKALESLREDNAGEATEKIGTFLQAALKRLPGERAIREDAERKRLERQQSRPSK